MHIQALYYYPVKALAAIPLPTARLQARGFEDDRRWMLIDEAGHFISQRSHLHLVHWKAEVVGDALHFSRQNSEQLYVVKQARSGQDRVVVTVWDDTFLALLLADAVLGELFAAMSLPASTRLVYMDEASIRPVDPRYAQAGQEERVSFADGYPYLIANTASLANFSQRQGREMAMLRFRPNIVIEGAPAWAEDDWQSLQIGGQSFRLPKPCARCQVVTIDPENGEKDLSVLAGLATFRKEGHKVLFGMNALWEGRDSAYLTVGDAVWVVG